MGDIADQLSEEILTEMACRFFGQRKQLDDMQETFTDCVRKLQLLEIEIARKLASLNHLLLNGKGTGSFFKAIGIDFPKPSAGIEAKAPCVSPESFGWAFSVRRQYQKLVFQAYGELQKFCRIYQLGDLGGDHSAMAASSGPVYFELILEMAQELNAKIEKVNASISPSCALSFVKRLNVAESEKEQFTGVIFGRHDSGLDDAMCFSPVDVDTLPITAYPDLPEPGKAKEAIYRFCKDFYDENREPIRCLMKAATNRGARSRK